MPTTLGLRAKMESATKSLRVVLLVTMASMAMLLLREQSDKRICVQVAELPLPLLPLLLPPPLLSLLLPLLLLALKSQKQPLSKH